ncbi:hypothetical protein BDY19DRAFT_990326 [Irpex rosettiformis]|uniref:Uncharacterized protein n=1 Tax=Irpex rosettiformis TaxID=378272 RepID=A0ACB8UED9_9APHY|nr:hypothetical protein BDY19DRAFT_990326 [Irpex rosettiformis]
MSSARYAPLPNAHTDPLAQNEMEAAFLDSDDEDEDVHTPQQARGRNGYQSLPDAEPAEQSPISPLHTTTGTTTGSHPRTRSTSAPTDGTYDFENVDYDADWTLRPPPGSPPSPTDALRTFRESQGNSNGLIPDFSDAARQLSQHRKRAGGWLRNMVPEGVARRLGMAREEGGSPPVVGGGLGNDGVFANVTAKPSRAVRVQDGDNIYLVPEETQKDAPPSYASAQADAVPPYWETTINIPSASTAPGDMIVDALPTGSLFSFLWNMLVSISFQFVGFLLTYLLHTTHAAKLGSRAGLGVTLIQYGFAMRSRAEEWAREGMAGENVDGWPFAPSPDPKPTFETAAEAEEYFRNLNGTLPNSNNVVVTPNNLFGDVATEWLSFFLMTVGWFILLTSLLSFWRVKRWERGILASSPSSSLPAPASSSPTSTFPSHPRTLLNRIGFFRRGLGFPVSDFPGTSSRQSSSGREETSSGRRSIFDDDLFAVSEREDGELEEVTTDTRGTYVIPIDETNPERTHRLARAYADEVRLQSDLRAAGLL